MSQMSENYDQLRYSFDNILKELDDICKGIDDIAENLPEFDESTDKNVHIQSKRLASININSTSFAVDEDSSLNVDYIDSNNNVESFNSERQLKNDDEFLSFEKNSYQSESLVIHENDNRKVEANLYYNSYYDKETSPINEQERLKGKQRSKHRLPNDESNSLNSAIGSVQESLFNKAFSNSFSMATDDVEANYNSDNTNTQTRRSNSRERTTNNDNFNHKLLNHSVHNQVSFQINDSDGEDESNETKNQDENVYENDNPVQYSSANEMIRSKQLISTNSCDTPDQDEDGDYLSEQEILKLKCFYSSMGCYVYVNRSIAELYQMKRDDAYDELDNDPVNDYRLYMERLENSKKNDNHDSNHGENGENDSTNNKHVNYMYINSGVPVIVFNYSENAKREKGLRILLVERSTGFCMWQFKFDWLTHFNNDNNITVARLAFNNKIVNNSNHINEKSRVNKESGILSTISSKLSQSTNTINYQNEYFEKFFSCTKISHKENLLKFIDKFDCDEFCNRQALIMEKNKEQFTVDVNTQNYANLSLRETNLTNNELLPAPPPPLDTSSVIICHFDFYNSKINTNRIDQSLYLNKPYSFQSLKDLTTDELNFNPHPQIKFLQEPSKISTIRTNLLKKYSISTNQLSTNNSSQTNTSIGAIIKRKLFGSSVDDLSKKKENKQTQGNLNFSALKFKFKKLRKSDISSPVTFNHVTHLDKPVPIGRRYKLNYKS